MRAVSFSTKDDCMSTSEPSTIAPTIPMAEPWDDMEAVPPLARAPRGSHRSYLKFDRGALACRGCRHHDVPGIADDRRGTAGGERGK